MPAALGWLAGFCAAAAITFVLTLAVKWAVYLIRVVRRRHGR
ncbi:hypothetical protein R75461_01149 [Paraburkholderia nemoris]|nr:hypothetical protein [Paraburkholderia nemoris]CAE6713058.1 hypothetical protein R75461_01149 [Paraburkholderia nemoris]